MNSQPKYSCGERVRVWYLGGWLVGEVVEWKRDDTAGHTYRVAAPRQGGNAHWRCEADVQPFNSYRGYVSRSSK
jgi:hypothetical protein